MNATSPMNAPSELCLSIYECSCSCGNTWTHSKPLLAGQGILGGTPSPNEEERFPVTSLMYSKANYSHCFRCTPLGLNIGWKEPLKDVLLKDVLRIPSTKPNRNRSTRPSIEDLDDDIFS